MKSSKIKKQISLIIYISFKKRNNLEYTGFIKLYYLYLVINLNNSLCLKIITDLKYEDKSDQ